MAVHKNLFVLSFFFFRIKKGDIEVEYTKQVKKIKDAKMDTLKQEDLKVQMEDFLQVSSPFIGQFGSGEF